MIQKLRWFFLSSWQDNKFSTGQSNSGRWNKSNHSDIRDRDVTLPGHICTFYVIFGRDVTSDTSKYRSPSSSRREIRSRTVNVSWAEDPIFPASITPVCTLVACCRKKKPHAITHDHRPSARTTVSPRQVTRYGNFFLFLPPFSL